MVKRKKIKLRNRGFFLEAGQENLIFRLFNRTACPPSLPEPSALDDIGKVSGSLILYRVSVLQPCFRQADVDLQRGGVGFLQRLAVVG